MGRKWNFKAPQELVGMPKHVTAAFYREMICKENQTEDKTWMPETSHLCCSGIKKKVHTHSYAHQAHTLSLKWELDMHRGTLSNSWLMPKDDSLPKHSRQWQLPLFVATSSLTTPTFRSERDWWQAVQDRRQLTWFSNKDGQNEANPMD